MALDHREDPLLSSLYALHGEADRLAALFGGALDPDTIHAGEDSSGAVRVTVNGAGQVTGVDLAEWWRTALSADRLGGAVQEAAGDAATRRLAAWAEAVAEGTPRRADPVPARPDPSPADGLSGDRLLALLREVEGQLDAFAQRVAEAGGRAATGHGDRGLATVTVSGGEVVRVDLDRSWLATADRSGIAAELRAAFAAAYRRAGDPPAEPAAIAELRSLTADFDALLRRLR